MSYEILVAECLLHRGPIQYRFTAQALSILNSKNKD